MDKPFPHLPRSPRFDRRRLLVAAAALPAACAAPRFDPPPPGAEGVVQRPRVGQRWRYAEIDRYSGRQRDEVLAQVVESQPDRVRIALTASARKRDDEVLAGPTRIVQEPFYDLTQVFEQPVPVLPDQLVAGPATLLRTRYHTLASPHDRLPWSDWLVVRGWQRVRVPAGEFDALRFDRLIHFQHVDIWREDCMRQDYAWYAPEVGRWVLREWTGRYLMPSGPDRTVAYEDWVRWELLDFEPPA